MSRSYRQLATFIVIAVLAAFLLTRRSVVLSIEVIPELLVLLLVPSVIGTLAWFIWRVFLYKYYRANRIRRIRERRELRDAATR